MAEHNKIRVLITNKQKAVNINLDEKLKGLENDKIKKEDKREELNDDLTELNKELADLNTQKESLISGNKKDSDKFSLILFVNRSHHNKSG